MQRDGIVEKPSEAEGPKQFWLRQMIGYVPLDYWTKTFGVSATATVEAAPPDYRAVFLRGWLASLSRRPVVEWIELLIASAGSKIRLDAAVLGAVPAARRAGILAALDRGADRRAVELPALLDAWQPLDEAVSQAMLETYELRLLLACDAHFHLHPTSLEPLAAQLNEWAEAPQHRRRIDQALLVIGLRLELHKEFAR
jgi:hypothetical protein